MPQIKTKIPNKKILEFIEYLKINGKNLSLDWLKINKDINDNLFFKSNIPQGYGLGSSGALVVAAFYNRYAKKKISLQQKLTKNKLQKLKNIFSKMESHFHGESSGIDPLNCYLGLPILIKSQKEIQISKIPEETH